MTTPVNPRAALEDSCGTHILPDYLREDLYSASAGCPETYRLWAELLLAAYGAGRGDARATVEFDAPPRGRG